jgi:SdrD B-like domain
VPFASLFAPAPARRPRPRRLAFERLDERIAPHCGCELPPSQISGLVYVDQNGDGVAQDTEPRLAGVAITLTGTSADGDSVTMTATTDAGGIYLFQGLEAGTYAIQATAPAGYVAGPSSVGAFGGTTGLNVTTNVSIPQGQSSGGYNFGERVPPPGPLCGGGDRGDRGHHYGSDKHTDNGDRPKGNNGVDNGLDPQPPGDPPVNDGPGTSPGRPGNRGGAKK